MRCLCKKDKPSVSEYTGEFYFQKGLASSEEFFRRFKGHVDFRNKTVIDIGCGLGSTCYFMISKGATKVLGVDIRPNAIDFARSKIKDFPNYSNRVEFKLLKDLDPDNCEKYDIVLSKDSFEHYQNPEEFVLFMKSFLKPGGKMIIGFSPLWKSPYGAHSAFISRWPWIHVIFPEHVVLGIFREICGNKSITYENWASGLNKMTVNRYLNIIKSEKLRLEYISFNESSSPRLRSLFVLFNGLRSIPGLKEYFTVNLYSVIM